MLKIYNSLTREKEEFTPIHPGRSGIYVCGNTVYDYCHLGHARSMVCFDVIVRFLRASGYVVNYVRNITDVEDKIIKRANERGIDTNTLTSEMIAAQVEDSAKLNILPPDHEPLATSHIVDIIELIQKMLEHGFAYVSNNGDVCFSVESYADYGQLSNQKIQDLQSGARVDVDLDKRCALDFVLWKLAKTGEPYWESPFGNGRPGWHIECSAMAMKALGEQFDIHGGGLDLQFPHHENEIAQSQCVTGKTFANYWMHVGMLQVNNEKMSKSVGNFFTIRDVLAKHHPEVLRYFLLKSHYRSQLNYSDEQVESSHKALSRLYQALKNIPLISTNVDLTLNNPWIKSFFDAMNDDFNTPLALAVLFDLSREINKTQSADLAAILLHLANILGLLEMEPDLFLKQTLGTQDLNLIGDLINARTEARLSRDWAKADEIRKQLLDLSVELEDGPKGTTWRFI